MNNYSTYVFWVTWVNNPIHDSSLAKLHFSFSLIRLLYGSPDSLLVGVLCGRHPHLPRGSSPSSRRHRTVGAGSPWTSHRKSTVSSSMTTWLTGLRTNTGRSTGRGKFSNMSRSLTDFVNIRNSPYTTSSAGSLSLSPTIFVPTQTYMPASFFLAWEIISLPPRIWKTAQWLRRRLVFRVKTADRHSSVLSPQPVIEK